MDQVGAESSRIAGVEIHSLRVIEDERGAVMHMLRSDAPWFTAFGEVYFSRVNAGAVKAWKRHREMTQHFAVPAGRIRLVLFDDRGRKGDAGILEVFELGLPDRYCLIRIPPMVWYGFQAIGDEPALIANCADLPHSPEESEQAACLPHQRRFDWNEYSQALNE